MEQERRQIKDVRAGDTVDQVFLIQGKDLRRTTTGAVYVACRLSDRSGVLDARWWQATQERFDGIPEGGFARITGRAQNHRGQLQLIIDEMTPVAMEAAQLGDFLPSTDQDIEVMWTELQAHLREIQNVHLRRLVAKFISDEELIGKFKSAPAATQLHHNVVGGLLEHTLNIVRLARAVSSVYGDSLNRDLLLVGAFLHDIGKAEELQVDSSFTYSDRGNLVGHMASAVIWIQQKADAIALELGVPFPGQIIDVVQHLVLSHHGSRERGSPRIPMIPEALVLHALDDMDMRIHMARSAIAKEQESQASFTSYHRHLDVKVYKRSLDLPDDGGGG